MAKSTKISTAVTSPALVSAWSKVVSTTGEADAKCVEAVLNLAKVRAKSTLTRVELRAAITATGETSKLISVGQLDGLVTMLNLQKFPEFAALKLADQLSQANAAYKFCGSGNAEQMASYEAVKNEVKTLRKAKNDKAKGSTPKTKTAKTKATDADIINDFIGFLADLEIGEDLSDLMTELGVLVESKIDTFNEALIG